MFLMMRAELAMGGKVPVHDHPGEEMFFMLDGEVDMEIEGKFHLLKAGDVAGLA